MPGAGGTLILYSYLNVRPLKWSATTSAFHDTVVVEAEKPSRTKCGSEIEPPWIQVKECVLLSFDVDRNNRTITPEITILHLNKLYVDSVLDEYLLMSKHM